MILEEYNRILKKVFSHFFKWLKDLYLAHHISNKKLQRYFRKWETGGKKDESLLPVKMGANPVPVNPMPIEYNIMKVNRKFGSNRYKLTTNLKKDYLMSGERAYEKSSRINSFILIHLIL